MANRPAHLCFVGWPIIPSSFITSWPMASWPVLHWLVHLCHSLPYWLADGCSSMLHWLVHGDQSHPYQLASGCSACALLADPSYQVPSLPAGQWLLGLCWLAIFISPSLASWLMTAHLCITGWPAAAQPCFAGWPIISSPSLAGWPAVAWPVPHWLVHLGQSLPCQLADVAAHLCITAGPW